LPAQRTEAVVTPERFRQVLGHFCTGVTVITTTENGLPAGFACQAFAALSLDPPLVVFCPARESATWEVIARTGHFAANLLAASQRDVARTFGMKGLNKFNEVRWEPSVAGDPVLDGALAWAGCTVEAVHDGGDHNVVIGRVTELGDVAPGEPLLFYRGRYGLDGGPPEVVDTLLAWSRHGDWI
jgi:3-hydroxy-9,10-secoandrosta-1,3,5(10)-triene-9,17-dione monooxygenase reductase component